MNLSAIAFEVEQLENEARKISALQLALSSAMLNGYDAASTYEWGFVAVEDLAIELTKRLYALKKELFAECKQKKKSASDGNLKADN